MNIIFLNSMKPDEFGGGEKWMIAAAKGLQHRGHRVFISGKAHSLFNQKAQQAQLSTVVFNIKGDFNPSTTWKIKRFLQKNKIDVLICNFTKDLRVGGLAARLAGTRLILARHGLLLCKKRWKYRITLKYLADGIITNSQAIKDIYLSYGWFEKAFIKVIYNGVDLALKSVPSDISTRYTGKIVLLAAGRLTLQKGFFYLIEAVHLLKQKRDDFHLIIAGDGALFQQLTQQIIDRKLSEYITLTGYVEDLSPYLHGCHMVVLSSLYEGMPNIILEAMAAGKAVVATSVHGVRELVQHQKTGLLVPAQDARALMQALANLMDDPKKREDFGQQGRKRVKYNFSMDAMIQNLEAYLIEMYRKRTGRDT
jgi:glycosyltransferase involved in cell wall biosynthesis